MTGNRVIPYSFPANEAASLSKQNGEGVVS